MAEEINPIPIFPPVSQSLVLHQDGLPYAELRRYKRQSRAVFTPIKTIKELAQGFLSDLGCKRIQEKGFHWKHYLADSQALGSWDLCKVLVVVLVINFTTEIRMMGFFFFWQTLQ